MSILLSHVHESILKFLMCLHVHEILCGHTHLLSELVEPECTDDSRV